MKFFATELSQATKQIRTRTGIGRGPVSIQRTAVELIGNTDLLLIDLSIPRNIDPAAGELKNVSLYSVDDLEAVARVEARERENLLPTAA